MILWHTHTYTLRQPITHKHTYSRYVCSYIQKAGPYWIPLYRVINKSLRNFRTRLNNNQDRHSRVDISSTCKVGQKLGVSLPLLTCSPSAWPSRLLYPQRSEIPEGLMNYPVFVLFQEAKNSSFLKLCYVLLWCLNQNVLRASCILCHVTSDSLTIFTEKVVFESITIYRYLSLDQYTRPSHSTVQAIVCMSECLWTAETWLFKM